MNCKDIVALIVDELSRANKMYGASFSSPHEGYAVMLEEMDELWAEIMKKSPAKHRLREEAIQVGAMAIKFILALEGDAKQSHSDVNCKTCRFHVMTKSEVAEHGSDPCDTCNSDFCNWQRRELRF